MLVYQVDESGQFVQVLFHSGEPQRDCWFAGVLFLLSGNEGADIAPDFSEGVYTAHTGIRFARCAVHRETVFIQSSIDQFLAPPGIEQYPIRVKEYINPACFEVTNHLRQVFIEQWFAQAVQHHALQLRKLIDDVAEVLEAQVAVIFPREQRARALLAQFVTSARRANHRSFRSSPAPLTGSSVQRETTRCRAGAHHTKYGSDGSPASCPGGPGVALLHVRPVRSPVSR